MQLPGILPALAVVALLTAASNASPNMPAARAASVEPTARIEAAARVESESQIQSSSKAPQAGKQADSLLIVSSKEHALVVQDPASGERTAFFRVGLNPNAVAVSPDGRTAVVTNRGERISGNSICVIDLYATNLVRTILLESSRKRPDQSVIKQMFHGPSGVVFVPGQSRVVVTCAVEGALLLVDLVEARVIGDVQLTGETAGDVVVDHSGRFAFVANQTSGTVTVVKLDRMRVVKTIEAGGGPSGMALHPTRNEIWLTNSETNSISIIDTDAIEERTEFSCGAMPVDLAFTPDGHYALVVNMQEGNVSVIETSTRRIRALLELERVSRAQAKARPAPKSGSFGRSPLPTRVMLDADGERAWISTQRDDRLHEVSLRSWRVKRSMDTALAPVGLGWSRKTEAPRSGLGGASR